MKLFNKEPVKKEEVLEPPFTFDEVYYKVKTPSLMEFKDPEGRLKNTFFIYDNFGSYSLFEDGSLKPYATNQYPLSTMYRFSERFYPESITFGNKIKYFHFAKKEEVADFFISEKKRLEKRITDPFESAINERENWDFNNSLNLFLKKNISSFVEERKNLKKQPKTNYFIIREGRRDRNYLGVVTNSEDFSERFIGELVVEKKISSFELGYCWKENYQDPSFEIFGLPLECKSAINYIENSNPLFVEHKSYFKE